MQARYEFTRLLVSHFRDCFRFYRDVMGLTVGFGTENDTYADFPMQGASLSLFDQAEMSQALGTGGLPASADAQDGICLVFAVPSVDEACRQVEHQGIRIDVPPMDHPEWGIRTAHFRDPDGHLIEINQPLAT
jgi:catechol 2,3-dioxygenase-like lactoylglutathione lyase family enzyme